MTGRPHGSESGITLGPEQFAEAFPFHIAVDRTLAIVQVGRTLARLCPDLQPGRPVAESLRVLRPTTAPSLSLALLEQRAATFILLEHQPTRLQLRGQFLQIADGFLFLGSPWLVDASELETRQLSYADFAAHDPVVDMLQIFQSNKIALADAARLVEKLKRQRMELLKSQNLLRQTTAELEQLAGRRAVEVRQALAALDAMADGAFIVEPSSLRYTYVNTGASVMLGYSREELLALSPLDLVIDSSESSLRAQLEVVRLGRSWTGLATYRHRSGAEIPVEASLTHLTYEGDSPIVIAVVRDITERIAQQRAVQKAQRLDAIGQVTAGIAHDLNNGLAPIVMGIDILRTDYPTESALLDTVETSTRRISEMVKTLLLIVKGRKAEKRAMQLTPILQEVAAMIAVSFPRNIAVSTTSSDDLPFVLADAAQLSQLVLNLCVNARDAMPNGGRLTLRTMVATVDSAYASFFSDATPGTYAVLEVRDTGVGMERAVLERIFDPFFTTKSPDSGTGLGLSSVLSVAKSHGGFVHVGSQPGKGSTFKVYLPVADTPPESSAVADTAMPFRGQGQTILLVDDEQPVRDMGVAVFRHLNFTPLTADNGPDALRQLMVHQSGIAAVITDLHMPELDGLMLSRAIRHIFPSLPIAVASGRFDDQTVEQLNTLGITHRLEKPFSMAQLAAILQALLTVDPRG